MPNMLMTLLVGLHLVGLSIQEDVVAQIDFSATITAGPAFIPSLAAFDVAKRAEPIPPNFCGWFSGSGYDKRWAYYDPTATCFWNSDAKFVGNANPPPTACVGQKELSTWSCSGSGCSSSIATCTGSQPYCVTFTYGSAYISFVCSEKGGVEYIMEPYWDGFSKPIAFPVYTGSKGISTGTQYPAGYPIPSSTTSSSPSPDSSSNFNAASSTAHGDSGSSTAGANLSSNDHSSAPIGAIVGGVSGGLAFISIVAAVLIFFVIIRPRQRRRLTQPQHHQPGIPPPQSLHSQPQLYQPGIQPPQVSRYEADTQYNKHELDSFRQHPQSTQGQQGIVSGGQQGHQKNGETVYEAP